MTVKELITKLLEMPMDAEIYIEDDFNRSIATDVSYDNSPFGEKVIIANDN